MPSQISEGSAKVQHWVEAIKIFFSFFFQLATNFKSRKRNKVFKIKIKFVWFDIKIVFWLICPSQIVVLLIEFRLGTFYHQKIARFFNHCYFSLRDINYISFNLKHCQQALYTFVHFLLEGPYRELGVYIGVLHLNTSHRPSVSWGLY